MSSGSMTQRRGTLPGLPGALAMVLGRDTAQVGNGSFPQEGLPRVALMFLTRGPMPYEPMWRMFLDGIPDKQQGALMQQMLSNLSTFWPVRAISGSCSWL